MDSHSFSLLFAAFLLATLAVLAIAVLALLGGWRWWVGAALPLSVDEAYYYAWSLTPDWGYWTKPPLIAWAIGSASAICGPTTACVRGVGVVAFTVSSWLIYLLSRSMGQSPSVSAAAGIGFATLIELTNPSAAFYLAPTRAFELLTGA